MISTKLFEGIALDVPLLAIIPSGEVQEIINNFSPCSYVITDQSTQEIAESISDAIFKYSKKEIQPNYAEKFLDAFSREKLTLRLIKIVEENLITK